MPSHRLVKRYRAGRCFAAAFSKDTSDKQIASAMQQGEAAFFPYDEAEGRFLFHLCSRPRRIRR